MKCVKSQKYPDDQLLYSNNRFQFIISKDKTFKHNLPIAYASSNKGIILVRLTMKHFNEYDELDKFRRTTIRKYL